MSMHHSAHSIAVRTLHHTHHKWLVIHASWICLIGFDDVRAEVQAKDLEEVIVTAQKHAERLQDVPVPVTVISGDTLVIGGMSRMENYYTKIPGLSLINPGGQAAPTIAIRGITTGGATGSSPTVGIVIDDLSYGSSTASAGGAYVTDLDPGELAQVEVLRGPQGTLYGASNIGGLLKYVTVDPSIEGFSGRVQAGTSLVKAGDDPGHSVRGAVNIPLGEVFAVRASGFTRRDPGYVDNVTAGESDVNSIDAKGARLAGLWRPSDAFSLKLTALWQDNETNGQPGVTIGPDFGDFEQTSLPGAGTYNQETRAYSATMNAALGGVSLVSATGYSTNHVVLRYDSPFFGLFGGPYGVTGGASDGIGETEKFTQEIRATFPIGERMDWLWGGFYTKESSASLEDYGAFDADTGAKAARLILLDTPSEFVEYAAFTNLTVRFTDRLDTQFGARISRNTSSFSTIRTGPLTPLFFGEEVSIVPEVESSESAFTYLVTPRFRLSPDLMVYARLASGYRPGGPIVTCGLDGIPCKFGSDTTRNYEVGLKGSTLQGALTFDASVYYIKWTDIQLGARSPNLDFLYTGNAGKAKSQGVELSMGWHSSGGFSIDGWVSWNEAELLEGFLPPTVDLVAAKGDRLPYSSPLSGGLSIDQEFDILSDWTAFVGASASFVDERKDVFKNGGPPPTIFPAYTQLDFRVGVKHGPWSVDGYVNNLADERGVLYRGELAGSGRPTAVYIQPRTIGVSLSKDF